MDLNVAVSTASELFGDGDMVFPISLGRENLKILASPGSESSGVSSLDAEEAKKLANEQLPSSNSPTLVSEPTSTSESSDGGSSSSDDTDDDKPSEQSPSECEQSADEQEHERSDANDDDNITTTNNNKTNDETDDDDNSSSERKGDELNDVKENSFVATIVDGDHVNIDVAIGVAPAATEQISTYAAAAANDQDNASIDLDDDIRYKNLKIIYGGRDVLDFGANTANKSWHIQYAYLPETNNFQMFMDNRSQYNRLSIGFQENPNHGYSLSKCGSCTFQYPVVFTEKADQIQDESTKNMTLCEILARNTASLCTPPIQSANVPAQRISPAVASDPTTLALLQNANMHSMNNLCNNFMMNNRNHMMNNYQSGKPIVKNADLLAAAAAAAAVGANNNNHTCFKHNMNSTMTGTNAFYGNNNTTSNAAAFNTLINQLGGNNAINASNLSAFESYFMNGSNNYGHGHNHNHQSNNSSASTTQQLNMAALAASFMNPNCQQPHQQQQQQQQQQQWYGMSRHNINKSGINCNANSHKAMPTYSHF